MVFGFWKMATAVKKLDRQTDIVNLVVEDVETLSKLTGVNTN